MWKAQNTSENIRGPSFSVVRLGRPTRYSLLNPHFLRNFTKKNTCITKVFNILSIIRKWNMRDPFMLHYVTVKVICFLEQIYIIIKVVQNCEKQIGHST